MFALYHFFDAEVVSYGNLLFIFSECFTEYTQYRLTGKTIQF